MPVNYQEVLCLAGSANFHVFPELGTLQIRGAPTKKRHGHFEPAEWPVLFPRILHPIQQFYSLGYLINVERLFLFAVESVEQKVLQN